MPIGDMSFQRIPDEVISVTTKMVLVSAVLVAVLVSGMDVTRVETVGLV